MLSNYSRDCLEVLGIFLTPFGLGIPAGVFIAKNKGLEWQVTALLYLVSDMILACVFEVLMLYFIRLTRDSEFIKLFLQEYRKLLTKLGFAKGINPTWFSLIMLSFGIDPMTGRAVAKASGHGFLSGWAIAICGDMMFFALVMYSTLLLKSVLGDGTIAAVTITVIVIGVPMALPYLKERFRSKA